MIQDHPQHQAHQHQGHAGHAYWLLGLNMVLSFVAMYVGMFTMIDGWGDFENNLNMGYMALTMLAAMGIIMLATMPGMFPRRRLNIVLYAGLAIVLVGSFIATRSQALIDDRQFIASMIPHHSGAILMCREADLTDAGLRDLCRRIEAAQRAEINEMRAIEARLPAR
jgi:uncharacterized protein (DUF305 family)